MLSSASTRLGDLVEECWTALEHGDIPRLKRVSGRIVLLAGEVFLLHVVVRVLKRAQGVLAAAEGEGHRE